MKTHLPAAARGRTQIDWLDSWHSFSFGEYYDPEHMGFGPLRVINEDFVKGGAGFPTHPHRDMEIITYVLSGSLEHKDSLGTGSVIKPGEVQMMRAGTGIRHSEFNPSKTEDVHLLQIWIIPDKQGLEPKYQQKTFAPEDMRNKLKLIVSPGGEDGALDISQDAKLFSAKLDKGKSVAFDAKPERNYWLQIARGAVEDGDARLGAGDALALQKETGAVTVTASEDAEILLFDMGR